MCNIFEIKNIELHIVFTLKWNLIKDLNATKALFLSLSSIIQLKVDETLLILIKMDTQATCVCPLLIISLTEDYLG